MPWRSLARLYWSIEQQGCPAGAAAVAARRGGTEAGTAAVVGIAAGAVGTEDGAAAAADTYAAAVTVVVAAENVEAAYEAEIAAADVAGSRPGHAVAAYAFASAEAASDD